MFNIYGIPEELRRLPQWCCSTARSKVPLNPKTGKAASVTDPSTWGTFEEAVNSGHHYIGFVLSKDDPFTIIDLDNPKGSAQVNRHATIIETFDSYTEYSKSGNGFHIVTKGFLPRGVRRDSVEVYSSERYMICTGNVLRDEAIKNRQELLDVLFNEMGGDIQQEYGLAEVDAIITDDQLLSMASNAENAAKFNSLCRGEWHGVYPSQSEADYALLSMLAFYTRSNEQVRRLFRMSTLGKRTKAIKNNTYIDRCLKKIRKKQNDYVDLSQFEESSPKCETVIAPPKKEPAMLPYPTGLIGEIAHYIYATSIRPVHEVGIAAALGLTAGIAGRSYNISNTGLNQYIILLAGTGTGKEGMANGIDRLIGSIRDTIPIASNFIGPSVFASGQGLLKMLDTQPCFVSVLGEFGLTLQQLCDPKANTAQLMLKRVLLDLYGKSGYKSILQPMVYSEKDKNTSIIHAPAVTILGEATPSTFLRNLDESHIVDGLIPRFSIVEYTGHRPHRNVQGAFLPPNPALKQKFGDFVTACISTQQNNTFCEVQMNSAGKALLDDYDVTIDRLHRESGENEINKELYNRAHLKALKMSALLAIGHNLHDPVISQENADWAIKFVNADINLIKQKFDNGEVGTGDAKMESDIRRKIIMYEAMPPGPLKGYKIPKQLEDKRRLIPYDYLRRALAPLAVFRNHRLGAVAAIKKTLIEMVEAEVLIQIPVEQAKQEFLTGAPVYTKGASF